MVVKSGERLANARLAASRLTTAFSLAFARLIQTPLRSEGVRSRDVHFGPFCFFVVGLLAVWVPAARASKIDHVHALTTILSISGNRAKRSLSYSSRSVFSKNRLFVHVVVDLCRE